MGDSRIVGHGLKDSIVELDGSWNQQGGVRGLGRHSGSRGYGLSQGSGRKRDAIKRLIFKIVRLE